MRLGLIADSHDRLPAIAELVAQFQERDVSMVLHAGDYCSPFALAPLHALTVPVVGVFGRNDGDRSGLAAAAAQGLATELFESPHSLEVGGRRLLLVHDVGEVAERSLAAHDLVIHGCIHRQEMKSRGSTLLVCPGEACGWLYGAPGAAIIDLDTNEVEFLKLGAPEWKT